MFEDLRRGGLSAQLHVLRMGKFTETMRNVT
jgi:hypothetical protein